MAAPFVTVRFHAADADADTLHTFQPVRGDSGSPAAPEKEFANDEAAARFYLARLLSTHADRAAHSLVASPGPAILPNLILAQSHRFDTAIPMRGPDGRKAGLTILRFDQIRDGHEVFGANAVVELDPKRQPVSMTAELAPPVAFLGLTKSESLKKEDALDRIAKSTGKPASDLKTVEDARLVYFYDENARRMRLTFFFKGVPAAPADFANLASWREWHGDSLDPPPSLCYPEVDYLVDAHDGEIVLSYSAAHYALDSLTSLKGVDESDVHQEFYGQVSGNSFELVDSLTGTRTYDLDFQEVGGTLASSGLQIPAADLATNYRAAVSACVNARRVYDFFSSVLNRHGVDNKEDTELVSVINCTLHGVNPSPREWRNACWWKGRMWYGQQNDPDRGRYVSFAEHLDVVAHELTHGITESTAKLVYRDLSGALNESFSDIFGIIIKNWYDTGQPLGKDRTPGRDGMHKGWSWEIGSGLGKDGGPLRDMEHPEKTGDPGHMHEYDPKYKQDSGGVHRYSAIHNKAVYHVMTARGDNGKFMFTPREVALLYYLALLNLKPFSDFTDALHALLRAASTFYLGDLAVRQPKLSAIVTAYQKVGIEVVKAEAPVGAKP